MLVKHDFGAIAHAPRALRVRRSPHVLRAPRVALAAMLVFVMISALIRPVPAFADGALSGSGGDYATPRVYYKPSSTSYIVVAPSNRFSAALGVIGKGSAVIQLNNQKQALLSNAETGGAFYVLSTYMQCLADSQPTWADPTVSFVASTRVKSAKTLYGAQWVWWCDNVSAQLRSDALRDFNKINNGETVGGGTTGDVVYLDFSGYQKFSKNTSSSGGVTGAWVSSYTRNPQSAGMQNKQTPYYCTSYYTRYEGMQYVTQTEQVTFKGFLPSTILAQYPISQYDYYCSVRSALNSTTSISLTNLNIYIAEKGVIQEVMASNSISGQTSSGIQIENTNEYIDTITHPNGVVHSYYLRTENGSGVSWDMVGTAGGFALSYVSGELTNAFHVTDYSASSSQMSGGPFFRLVGQSSGGGNVPDNHWPEPTSPVGGNPEVPGPTGPDVTPVEPENPTIDVDTPGGNVTVTVVMPPSNTTPADYTPWLRAILDVLNNTLDYLYEMLGYIRSDLTTHCNHIRECIGEEVDYLAKSFRYNMRAIIEDLEWYLHDLFVWLANEISFSFTDVGYDDNTVIMWLRKIYQRLSGGTPTIPDPSTDEEQDGFLDWLWEMFYQLLIGLVSVGNDTLDGLAELIGDLVHLFPISVPWDIAALLALFSAEPRTPEFHFDMVGSIGSWTYDYDIDVNLHWLDDTMSIVRTLELVLFAGMLLWHTKDLLEIFNWVGLTND